MSAYTDRGGGAAVIRGRGIEYMLTKPLLWHIGAETGPEYVVPAGFVFDVSVPVGLRWLFNPRAPSYLKAAALHDHMLSSGWNRLTAAAEFHEALKADGVTAWRRLAMFLATALFRFS